MMTTLDELRALTLVLWEHYDQHPEGPEDGARSQYLHAALHCIEAAMDPDNDYHYLMARGYVQMGFDVIARRRAQKGKGE